MISSPVTGNFLPFFIKTDLASAPSYLLDRVLTPELWSSVISVCIGIGSLVGAAILSTRKPADKCGHTIAVCLCVIAALMISVTLIYWLSVDRGNAMNLFLFAFSTGSLIIGLMIAWINIPVTTIMMRIVDRDKLSKVNSLISIGSQGMTPIASVLAGAVLQSLGSTALLLACTLGFAATAAMLMANRQVRDL